jgi:hypothetical protein
MITDLKQTAMLKTGKILLMLALLTGFAFKKADSGLLDLVGQPVKSNRAQSLIQKSGKYEESRFDDSYYYVFRKKGFDLMMTTSDTISAVFVYASGADKHKKYKGDLPFGLTITMTRAEVEKALGAPDYSGGSAIIPYYSGWDQKGIGVTYNDLDTMDMGNRVHHISFSKKTRE